MSDPSIILPGSNYRIVEVTEMLPGSTEAGAYCSVDPAQGVIWLCNKTPVSERTEILMDAWIVASRHPIPLCLDVD